MTKRIIYGVFVALLVLLSANPASAQDDEPPSIYYVRRDHTGCEDGSQECPFSTRNEAIDAGYAQVCEGRTFEVHEWNSDALQYEYYDTFTGQKPIPPMGQPMAQSLQILLIALTGLFLLILAIYVLGRTGKEGQEATQHKTDS